MGAEGWLKLTDGLLLIVSLLMLGTGSFEIYKRSQENIDVFSVYTWGAALLTGVGVYALVLSLLGYIGAKSSKARALLFPYFVALLSLFGLLIAIVAALSPARIGVALPTSTVHWWKL